MLSAFLKMGQTWALYYKACCGESIHAVGRLQEPLPPLLQRDVGDKLFVQQPGAAVFLKVPGTFLPETVQGQLSPGSYISGRPVSQVLHPGCVLEQVYHSVHAPQLCLQLDGHFLLGLHPPCHAPTGLGGGDL